MATATAGRGGVKERNLDAGRGAGEIVADRLEELAHQGAREMLMAALQEERDAYLGRGRYEHSDVHRGHRNGSTPHRLTPGCGTVQLDVPRVRDIPPGQAPFESKLVRRYQRRSDTIDETFMKLFIEGLATRDFEPALRLLVGEQAPLSPSAISRLTQKFKAAYAAFEKQDLGERHYVYIWADGIYLKAGLDTEKACLIVRMLVGEAKSAFLDLETTGLFPAMGDRIVEIGLIVCQGVRESRDRDRSGTPRSRLDPADDTLGCNRG